MSTATDKEIERTIGTWQSMAEHYIRKGKNPHESLINQAHIDYFAKAVLWLIAERDRLLEEQQDAA